MSNFSLVVLGNGGGVNQRLPHNGLVINKNFLVDCPPDVIQSFQMVGLSTLDIEYVFISHFHADHTFGFPLFLLNRWIAGDNGGSRSTPFKVFGPAGTREYLTRIVDLGLQSGHPTVDWFNKNVEIHEMDPLEKVSISNVQLEFFRLKHIDSSIGFALSDSSGAILFSYLTDTVWGTEVELQLAKFPVFAWIDMNGGNSGVHASYEDTLSKGLLITGERTTYLGSHVAETMSSSDRRIRMVEQGDVYSIG